MPKNVPPFVLSVACFLLIQISPFPSWAKPDASTERPVWTAPSYKARKANPIPKDSASLEKGKRVFTQQCVVCHGAAGKGDGVAAVALVPSPASLVDPQVQGQSDGTLFWKLSTGRAPMPAFEALLSDEDRWNVINYIRSLVSGTKP